MTADNKKKVEALTPELQEFIDGKLSSKFWRLNNLYTIQDKNGKLRKLALNASQIKVLQQFKHNKKIILKSRQQGISTLYIAYYLDACIFKGNYSAGIQSYGQDEADKLSKRAELMWDHLDPEIKQLLGIKLVSNNSKGMSLSNGSLFKIGNFRGDTLQGLHVSELGKIAKRYPEKAKELKTGAFQAVSVSNKITIESTAEGRTGLFYEMWQKAETRSASTRGLTSLDFQTIFLSWMADPDCQLFEEYPVGPEVLKYAEEVKRDLDITLTDPQLWWLGGKLDELGDDFDQEYPSTPDKAFASQVEGMYFKKQYLRLIKDKRIQAAPYNPEYGVSVSFDLGINDETVILFAQVIEGQPYLIDEYHGTDEGIVHYADVLKTLKYAGNYKEFIFPHDIMVRDYSTGRTRLETFQREGFSNCRVLEKLSFQDSIEAARQFIDVIIVDDGAENTLLALQNYRKKYDRRLGVFLGTDEHDIHSNYAAALRYMAQGLSYHRVKNTRTKPLEVRYNDYKRLNINGFAI